MNNYTQIFANGCTDEAIDLAISKATVIVTEKIVLDYPKYVQMMHEQTMLKELSVACKKAHQAGISLAGMIKDVESLKALIEKFKTNKQK